jgi:tripartite ATP-independent transporter DctM subunit
LTLLSGFPVAFVLAGVSFLFAFLGAALGVFNLDILAALPGRIYGIMINDLLLAVPLFVFMGVVLERARIAEELLETMAALFGGLRGGLGFSVLLVGALLAASTGIVGATVVTMGLISLPTMLKAGYCKRVACGTLCAAGTLGQIIPPSVVLILLGDQITSAWQTSQLKAGVTSPSPVTIADLFVGALVPGLLLVVGYAIWLAIYAFAYPNRMPPLSLSDRQRLFEDGIAHRLLRVLFPPLLLILLVLGSIIMGLATATESAAMGGIGALGLALARRSLNFQTLREVVQSTARITSMIFTILIGATVFSLVFRGFGGEHVVAEFLHGLPGGLFGAMFVVMAVMFLLGFFLDFIEIIFIVVPIVAPILLSLGADPVWLAIMMAVNLQTSFLTPPFGFSLFYLRGVAPPEVKTGEIYRGVIPFVAVQLLMLLLLTTLPSLATWLPKTVYGSEFQHIKPVSADNGPVSSSGSGTETWIIDY